MNSDQVITVYAAHGDGGERYIGPIIGVFSTESSARGFAQKRGWWGGDGAVSERKAVRLASGEVYLLDKDNSDPIDLDRQQAEYDASLREKTLAGLSDEQKRVLGIS